MIDILMEVKNLNGTGDNDPPNGYNSWREWWEDHTGRSFGVCSCSDCANKAQVGAHVQKTKGDQKWYIVPLCISCNTGKKNQTFLVKAKDMVPVNP